MGILANLKATGKCVGAWAKNHAPELFLAGGYASGIAALYLTARGAHKAEEVTYEFNQRKADTETKQEVKKVYGDAVVGYIKAYAPAAGCAILSGTCFGASYGYLKKQYVGLAGMYVALDASYQAYRNRVIEDVGQEKDVYYLTGLKAKKITVTNEDGSKEKKSVLDLPETSIHAPNPYIFKFGKYKFSGDRNVQWSNDAILNMSYVLGQQDYLNDKLYSSCTFNKNQEVIMRGAVYLNEVRELLGEDPSPAGAVTGWLFGNGEPGRNGYIDFRVIEGYEEDPETGEEIPYILIDPNVDGLIYDLVGQFEEEPFIAKFYDDVPLLETEE